MSLRISLAQIDLLVGDIAGNAERVIAAALHARDAQNAHAVVFPELALCGYPPEDLLLRRECDLRVADALREKQPKLGSLMDASRDDVLAYMDFPREHWAQIASTNPLERVNREIKRRADVIGIFPNDGAIIRLVGALMLETNDEWTVARRYMSLETIARVTDNPTVRLSAVAT